jgi:hypothetical protein
MTFRAVLIFRALTWLIRAGPAGLSSATAGIPGQVQAGQAEEDDRLTEPGAKGTPLRREAVYFSTIIEWRRAHDAGAVAGVASKPARWSGKTPEQRENERLAAELAKPRLRWRLWKAHARLGPNPLTKDRSG